MLAFKKILVPVDFNPSSEEAVRVATDLAKRFGSELTILHVWEVPAYAYGGMDSVVDLLTPARELAQEKLDAKVEALREGGAAVNGVLRCGSAWLELRAAIEELAPDLVVMGTHGRSGLSRVILGSVAEKTVRFSAAPVLTVRGTEPTATTASTSVTP